MQKIIKCFSGALLAAALSACASTENKVDDYVGEISQQQLLTDYAVFANGHSSFALTEVQKNQLTALPRGTSLEVYFGTWCHDSEREVPRLLKAFAQRPDIPVTMYALDYHKLDPDGRAEDAGVKFTPTIIVKFKGQEMGRIIERPKINLVADISAMFDR
ncbi:thioredoxin family protein [Thalassotalea euphylliae]|uniref:thioredoxin family protein n=1 Tax=Thalassotalea euphylliae TaxID=1655234 RepID=UPI003644FF31